ARSPHHGRILLWSVSRTNPSSPGIFVADEFMQTLITAVCASAANEVLRSMTWRKPGDDPPSDFESTRALRGVAEALAAGACVARWPQLAYTTWHCWWPGRTAAAWLAKDRPLWDVDCSGAAGPHARRRAIPQRWFVTRAPSAPVCAD